ncbi:hypothetical protein M9Y10_028082 [Tritrichomonas musculus]|uniref:Uncharacterized protein n=1 Tax=Tritrichomonas musculus TaxID=1915356 RepID=A0ABR2KJA2_9EUKA
MTDMTSFIDNFCDQWAATLAAKLCFASNKDPTSLDNSISSAVRSAKSQQVANALNSGLQLSRTNTSEQVTMMSNSIENIFNQFQTDPLFPKLFANIFNYADQILSSIIDTSSRTKSALHTDQIIQEEKLSPLDQLNCETFVYLSSLLVSATEVSASENKENVDNDHGQIGQIDTGLINVIFKYVDHSLPNTVRASAGKILCALSASPKHCKAISEYFWNAFKACKKDDDFRNFASLIDGVQDLQLSLETPELAEAAIGFITLFATNVKKIERGVLRMKFLSAMDSIITRLCSNQQKAMENAEFGKLINDIWNTVVKWSSKSKHTVFCLRFLQRVATVMWPQFFIQDHGKQLFDLLFKCVNSTKGDVETLHIIRDAITGLSNQYYENQFADFKTIIENGLTPTLFKVSPQYHLPKYKNPDQTEAVVQIYVEIGKKKFLPVVDLCRAIFKEPDPVESKAGRIIFVRVLGELSKWIPDTLVEFNDELYQYIQSMLLGATSNPEETKYAILTFPLLYSPDDTVLAQMSQVIFDTSLNDREGTESNAYKSVISYIEKLITLKRNPLTVINYCKTLTNLIVTFPKEEIMKKLNYLYGIVKSFNFALSKESNLDEVKTGNFALGVQDWVEFRTKFDEAMLCLLVYQDNDIIKKAREIEALFLQDAYLKLDDICLPKPKYNVCNLLQDINEKSGDIVRSLPKLTQSNSKIFENIFDSLILTWRDNYSRFEKQYRGRYIELMGALARPESHQLKMFLEEIFILYKKFVTYPPLSVSIELTMPELWVTILNELATWMASSGLTIPNFWSQYTNIYSAIANHPEFKTQLEKNPKLVEHMERYISATWRQNSLTNNDDPNSAAANAAPIGDQQYFITCQKALNIIILYVSQSPTHFSRILEPKKEAYQQFLEGLNQMLMFESKDKFPPSYLETYLKTLETVFTYSKFTDPEIIDNFMAWLEIVSSQGMQNEQNQKLIVQVLEIALSQNPVFITNYFKNSITSFGIYASQVILAISNVYSKEAANFDEKYPNGNAVVLATVLLHLKNTNALPRQAALKLMCILITKSKIFEKKVPTYLMMCLTSHSTAGYVTQSSHFVDYASQNVSSKLAMKVFQIFTSNFKKMLDFQEQLLLVLASFLKLFVIECPIKEAIPLLLKLTAQSDFTDAEISQSISTFWLKYFSFIKKEEVQEAAKIIVDFAASQKSLKSLETFAAINVLVFAFEMSEGEVINYLYEYLNIYDKKAPKHYDEFIQFVSKPSVDFTKVTPQAIIASNAMSQILLSIKSQEVFKEIVKPKLAPLMFFASINYDNDEFAITPFHPLLDAILTTALFRFAKKPSVFSSNLASLQAANLVMRASSLDQQYEIYVGTSSSKHIIPYDQTAIQTFTSLLCQSSSKFKSKFFEIVLANAFMITDNPRTVEPFLMLMALIDQLDTRDVFSLMLYSLCAFQSNRTDIVDSIIDIVKQRMLSEDLDSKTFAKEATSIIACFILFLSLKCRRTLSIHIIKIIADIAHRALQIEEKGAIAKELSGFLNKFGGEEYAASLFVRFIDESVSFGDPSVDDIIRCLSEIAQLIISDNSQVGDFNWCFILAFLMDGYRHFLAAMADRPIPKQIVSKEIFDFENKELQISDFAEFLNNNLVGLSYKQFVVEFFAHGLTSFKMNDLYRDNVAIMIIRYYLEFSKVNLNPNLYDNLVKISLLLAISCDENGKQEAAHLIKWLVNHSDHSINSQYLSYTEIKPKFVEGTLKPIGYFTPYKKTLVAPESLPSVKIFRSAQETQDVTNFLMEHLHSKLRKC